MKRYRTRRFWLDLGERIAWTAAQAGLGLVTVDALDLPPAYAVPVAAALAALKGYVASHVGDPDSAATLPASSE